MATKTLGDAVYWNGILVSKSGGLDADSVLGGPKIFPSEFPYEIDSPPLESVLSFKGTMESGDEEAEEEEEEDFLAELTRRLTRSSAPEPHKSAYPGFCLSKPEKLWTVSGSPNSTLSGLNGWSPNHGGGISRDSSPNGGSAAPSPPRTPLVSQNSNADWDLIYAAAGQVARLRLTGEEGAPIGLPICPIKSHSPIPVTKTPCSGFYSVHAPSDGLSQTNQFQKAKEEQVLRSYSPVWTKTVKMNSLSQENQRVHCRIRGIGYENNDGRCGGGRPLGLPQSAWPSLQARNTQQSQSRPNLRALFLNGSGSVKRECTGTGVFLPLPRRYDNPAPEPRKRSGCSTLIPAKVVQALNLNLDDVNAHSQQRFTSDYDVLVAKQNAFLAQQRRSLRPDGGITHEVRLPQEWTY